MTTTNDQNDPKTLEALISRMRETLGFAESLLEPKDDESSEPTFDQRGDPKLASEMTTTRMLVYWIGCAGLQTAAQRLGPGQRIDRIGCTTERDLADRLSATSADAYGSWARDATGVLASEPGFERWIMQRIGATRGALDPAVMVRTRSIEIQLPAGMTRRWFDRALHTALSPWCLATRIPAATRYTRYSVGVERMSKALELYVGLDPRYDGDRLLALVEKILKSYRAKAAQSHPDARSAPVPKSCATMARAIGGPARETKSLDQERVAPSRLPVAKTRLRIQTMSPAQRRAMRARLKQQRLRNTG